VGFIPFSGIYPLYRGKENVFCVRSLTPPQAAGNALAVKFKSEAPRPQDESFEKMVFQRSAGALPVRSQKSE